MQEDQNQNPTPGIDQAQPGQVVTPGAAAAPSPQPTQQNVAPTPQQPAIPQAQVSQPPIQPAQQMPAPEPPTETAQESPSLYSMEGDEIPQQSEAAGDVVSWSASEYIAHDKDLSWYAGLGLVAIILAALLYFITRDFVSSFVALFGAFMLGFYGARKPRQLTYELDNQGLTIGEKHYDYIDFKKFSLVPEGAFSSIRFVPHKRFGPPITIYYGPDDEDRIVDVLSAHLPIEEHKIDATDRLMRRIRF